VFYDLKKAIDTKTEHNGDKFNRKHIGTFKEESLVGNPRAKNVTIAELKKISNHEERTSYHLIMSNCHLYSVEIDGLLTEPDPSKNDLVSSLKRKEQKSPRKKT
jgi:hypothetical protein